MPERGALRAPESRRFARAHTNRLRRKQSRCSRRRRHLCTNRPSAPRRDAAEARFVRDVTLLQKGSLPKAEAVHQAHNAVAQSIRRIAVHGNPVFLDTDCKRFLSRRIAAAGVQQYDRRRFQLQEVRCVECRIQLQCRHSCGPEETFANASPSGDQCGPRFLGNSSFQRESIAVSSSRGLAVVSRAKPIEVIF